MELFLQMWEYIKENLIKIHEKKNELGLRLKDGVRGYEDTGERMYMRDFTISYPTMKGYA